MKTKYEPKFVGRPFTGAWIETAQMAAFLVSIASRPFTGAWIETMRYWIRCVAQPVAPSRGRGLKQFPSGEMIGDILSSLTGARIESYILVLALRSKLSDFVVGVRINKTQRV